MVVLQWKKNAAGTKRSRAGTVSCKRGIGPPHLPSSKDGHVALTLPEEGQVTGREVILLLSFACSQVKDTVPHPVASLQHCMDSWRRKTCSGILSTVVEVCYVQLKLFTSHTPLESTFTARISAFSGMQSFLGVR